MPVWTTAFSAPAQLTGLTATPDPATSAVELAWDVSALSADHFTRYVIYRRGVRTGTFMPVGEATTQADPTFVDIAAPQGVSADYYVTADNGWAESEASETASTLLDPLYWFVHPTDPSLRFQVPHVEGYQEGSDDAGQEFRPLGRTAVVVASTGALAPSGSLTAVLLPAESSVYHLLRRLLDATPWVYLKNVDGDVHKVKVRSVGKDRSQAVGQRISVGWTTVEA